jgi:hypothetical protein
MEPLAGDATEDNLGPVGRVAYAFSTMACVPVSLSQEVGMALGAQAGQAKLTEVIKAGGFSQVRRAWSRPRLVHVRFDPDSDRQPSKRDPALRANNRDRAVRGDR